MILLLEGYNNKEMFFIYTVTWKRDNIEIKNSSTHVVKVEGERHSLLIKWTKPSDAGTYTVTATNEVGEVSSSATLFIKSGECFMVKMFLHTG